MAHTKLRAVFTLMGKMWGTPLRASLQWDSGPRCEIRSGSDSVSREAVRAVRWASWRRWRCAGALLNPRDNRTDSPRSCQGLGAPPALRIPSAHGQRDPPPPGPRGARPDLLHLPMPRHCGPSGPCIPGWAWSPPAHGTHPSLVRGGAVRGPRRPPPACSPSRCWLTPGALSSEVG